MQNFITTSKLENHIRNVYSNLEDLKVDAKEAGGFDELVMNGTFLTSPTQIREFVNELNINTELLDDTELINLYTESLTNSIIELLS